MKYIIIIVVCVVIIGGGYHEISYQHRKTTLIDQSVRLIGYIRTQLNYRRSDCETLYRNACDSGFECISFEDGKLVPCGDFPENVRGELNTFFCSLGTTDAEGQILLCDEYYERIKMLSEEQRSAEKSKVLVDFAICFLGVFSVIVLFL